MCCGVLDSSDVGTRLSRLGRRSQSHESRKEVDVLAHSDPTAITI